MLATPAPKAQPRILEPLSRDEITRILKAGDSAKTATTQQRATFVMKRDTARRDRAIILTLLDVGLRASELCQRKANTLR